MELSAAPPTPWLRKRAALTLSFDCDYSRDVGAFPHACDQLRAHDISASFAVVGLWVERYPDLHRSLVDAGHEIVNHTYSHPDNEEINPGRKFRLISREEKKEELVRAHEIIASVLGIECDGCRIPHFKDLFTPEIYGILAAGRPTLYVGPDAGEVADIIESGRCGSRVAAGDARGLALAIERYERDAALREEEGRRARELFELRFARPRALRAFERLIAQGGKRGSGVEPWPSS